MNDSQCMALRDLLFVHRFPTNPHERMFRFMAVTPGVVGGSDATVHFAYAPAVWDRAGLDSTTDDVVSMLKILVENSPYKDDRLTLQFHDFLNGGWPLPWSITAKDSFNDFPVMVLLESPDGGVTGALMRDPHCDNVSAKLANAYAEPLEVVGLIEKLISLQQSEQFLGWYKDCSLAAESLDAAIASTPESEAGQKRVLIYRGVEWLDGLWNNPIKPDAYPMTLSSLADFHGTRTSAGKRKSRGGLNVAKRNQTIPGDYDVLDEALALLTPADGKSGCDYELLGAVKLLCNWWNTKAPESMRSAALFRVYAWDPENKTFVPGDPEEPAMQVEALSNNTSYALFELDGRPAVALTFYRGRAFNKEYDFGTQTYCTDGSPGWEIGVPVDQVDEAYYTLKGLRFLSESHYF
jgi:hypothetical protein